MERRVKGWKVGRMDLYKGKRMKGQQVEWMDG
jgi:hypothetical protein